MSIREHRPHRLIIPFVAALALTLSVIVFHALESRGVTPDHAASISAFISFFLVVFIGFAFKPMLGE